MEPIIIGFVREEMMNALLLWRRSLQKRLNPGVNNFMQKKGFFYTNEEIEGTVHGAELF